MRKVARVALAAIFIGAGFLHYRYPEQLMRIVPPGLGDPKVDVMVSGVAEILGGAGLLIRPVRRAAMFGLLALLIAVWPANWFMALHSPRFANIAPAWALWLRLPFQIVLAYAIIIAGRTDSK